MGTLHVAVSQGSLNAVKTAIEQNKENINTQDENGFTALHLACEQGYTEIVQYLLAQNADLSLQNNFGYSALDFALIKYRHGIATKLLEAYAIQQNDGSTPLHHGLNKWGALQAELNEHADPLCQKLQKSLDQVLFELMMSVKGSFTEKSHQQNEATIMHLAAMYGHVRILNFLISKNLPLEPRTKQGFTPLHLSCDFGQLETTRVLLAAGADAEAEDNSLQRPLHLAAKKNRKLIVKLLLKYEVLLGMRNTAGQTPAEVASSRGHQEIVALLDPAKIVSKKQAMTTWVTVLGKARDQEKRQTMRLFSQFESILDKKLEQHGNQIQVYLEQNKQELKLVFEEGIQGLTRAVIETLNNNLKKDADVFKKRHETALLKKDKHGMFIYLLQNKLTHLFMKCSGVTEGIMDRQADKRQDAFDFGSELIDELGDVFELIPIPCASVLAKVAIKGGKMIYEKYKEAQYEKVAKFTDGLSDTGQLIEYVSTRIADIYREQIEKLTPKGCNDLAQTAVKLMTSHLITERLDKELEMAEVESRAVDPGQMLLFGIWVYNRKAGTLANTSIETEPQLKLKWTAEGVLQRSGFKVVGEEGTQFFICSSSKHNRADKYGFRLCSPQEKEFYLRYWEEKNEDMSKYGLVPHNSQPPSYMPPAPVSMASTLQKMGLLAQPVASSSTSSIADKTFGVPKPR